MAHSLASSSGRSQKTNYNKYIPRSFLLSYTAALQDPKEEAILSRVHNFNCEWLQRPNMAISEMTQTIRENIPLIRQYSGTIFVPEFVQDLLQLLQSLSAALSRLDNKDKSTTEPPTREDVISVLRTLDGDVDLEESIVDGFNVAGLLLMKCIHLLVRQTLMWNPESGNKSDS